MDWNKSIIFEEFWPIFLLFFIRHNKPWRQFEIVHSATSLADRPCRKRKNYEHWVPVVLSKYGGIFLIWWNHHESWVSSPAENGGLIASKLSERFAEFPRCFRHNPSKDYLSIDFRDFLLHLDCFIQHDRWFLHLQSQRRSVNFSSLPGWYWVSCNCLGTLI